MQPCLGSPAWDPGLSRRGQTPTCLSARLDCGRLEERNARVSSSVAETCSLGCSTSPGPPRLGCRLPHREAGEVDSCIVSTIYGCVKKYKPDQTHPQTATEQTQALRTLLGPGVSPHLPDDGCSDFSARANAWQCGGGRGVSPRTAARECLKPI